MHSLPAAATALLRRRGPLWIALAVALLVVGMHGGSLTRWFDNPDDWDHLDVAARLRAFDGAAWWEAFFGDLGIASLRPLPTLLWALDQAVWGFAASGYYATNLALHGALSGLVVLLAHAAGARWSASGAAGVLLGLSLASDQATYYLAGRDDLLANVLLVGALLVWVRGGDRRGARWGTAVLALLSALCKPTALLLPLALLVADRVLPTPRPRGASELLRRQLPVLLLLGAYAVALFAVVGAGGGRLVPSAEGSTGQVLLVLLRNLLGSQLLPASARDHSLGMIALDVPRGLALLGLLLVGARAARPTGLSALGAAVFAVGVVMPLPFLAQDGFRAMDEGRYLQLPTVGFGLLVAALASPAARGRWADGLCGLLVLGTAWGVLACNGAGSPRFSPSRALFDALVHAAPRRGPEGRLVVGLKRLDAGVTSLVASDFLRSALPPGTPAPLLFLEGGRELFASRRGGERFNYAAFSVVEAGFSLASLRPGVDVLLVDGELLGPEGPRAVFAEVALEPAAFRGQSGGDSMELDFAGEGAPGWTLFRPGRGPEGPGDQESGSAPAEPGRGLRLRGTDVTPPAALWRIQRFAPRPLAWFGSPPLDLPTHTVCAATLRVSVPGGEVMGGARGPVGFAVPTGRFALLMFSEEVTPAAPYARWLLVPLPAAAEGGEARVATVDLRNSPTWRSLRRVRWLGVMPSNMPGVAHVGGLTLHACP